MSSGSEVRFSSGAARIPPAIAPAPCTVDSLITSSVGLLLAALLIVAGALLIWAYTFTNNQVTSQLTEQQITFPAANSPAIKALPPADASAMIQYAGQQLSNGAQAQTQTVFQGTTLRGLLLNAYAFWQIGQIALWAAIASFIGAFIFLVLSILGFLHMRRTPAEAALPPRVHV
jgi:uncharacterized membrane protein